MVENFHVESAAVRNHCSLFRELRAHSSTIVSNADTFLLRICLCLEQPGTKSGSRLRNDREVHSVRPGSENSPNARCPKTQRASEMCIELFEIGAPNDGFDFSATLWIRIALQPLPSPLQKFFLREHGASIADFASA